MGNKYNKVIKLQCNRRKTASLVRPAVTFLGTLQCWELPGKTAAPQRTHAVLVDFPSHVWLVHLAIRTQCQ